MQYYNYNYNYTTIYIVITVIALELNDHYVFFKEWLRKLLNFTILLMYRLLFCLITIYTYIYSFPELFFGIFIVNFIF